MSDAEQARWREERRVAADAHRAAAQRRQAAETEQARRLIADFVAEARRRGLPDTPLRAGEGSGGPTYRTPLRGWYVRRNRTLAVGGDGEFYILTAPRSWRARLTGVTIPPSDPPLVVGRGGRDGESIPLADLLRQRLDAGADWP